MLGHIYMLFNRTNRKSYIGKSKYPFQHPKAHWRRYLNGGGEPQQHIVRAIQKNGSDNFAVFCLESCISQSLIDERERFYICQYNTKEQGYNRTDGGDGGKGYKWTDEQREKAAERARGNQHHKNRVFSHDALKRIGAAHRGKIVSAKTRQKLREANLGKTMSIETRQKLSERPISLETRRKMSQRIISPETRKRLSESAKRDWQKRKHNPNQLTLFDK